MTVRWIALTTVIFFAIAPAATAQGLVLYDETLGNLPADQSWFTYITNSPPTSSQTYLAGRGVEMISDQATSAGYFNQNPITGTLVNPAFPQLNRATGFQLNWNLQVNSESHANSNRAGFSMILLASDHRGLELAFWNNEVWAQTDSPLFTHGEGAIFSTTTQTNYQLLIFGNSYDLKADGTSILNGSLRDYSGFGIPYTHANFLFLGDDTSSAGGDFTLGRVTLLTAVPEPALSLSVGIMLMVCVAWLIRRNRIRVLAETPIQASPD